MGKMIKKIMASLIAGVCALVLILQIPKVNSWVVQTLFNLWLPQSYRISIDSITGTFPFEINIKRISIHDRYGRWLKLKDVNYSWRGVDLLFKKITFDHFAISGVSLYRIPEHIPEPESTQESLLPDHLPFINIKEIRINNLKAFGLIHTGLEGQISTLTQDRHRVTLNLISNDGNDKIMQFNGSLVDDRVALTFNLEDDFEKIAQIFPTFRNHLKAGTICSNFEFYSNRKLQEISGYFSGHIKDLETTHSLMKQVIGRDLDWTINTNFKRPDPHLHFVGRIHSAAGLDVKWESELLSEAQQILGQMHVKIPNIQEFQWLGDAYAGDLIFTSTINKNVMNWTLTGLTYQGKALNSSQGQVYFEKISPYIQIDFKGQLGLPGLRPTFSGRWHQDQEGWVLDKINIQDAPFTIHLDLVQRDLISGNLNADVRDLSVLKPIVGINLLGQNRLQVHMTNGQGTYDVSWDYEKTHGKLVGRLELPSNHDKTITVQECAIVRQDHSIFALQKPWTIQWLGENVRFSPGLFHVGQGLLEIKEGTLNSHLSGDVRLKNLSLRLLTALGMESDIQGTLNGSLSLSGTWEHPEFIATLKMDKISLPDESRKHKKYINGDVSIERHGAEYRIRGVYQDSLQSSLKGEAKVISQGFLPDDSDPISWSIQGHLNISILNGFLDSGDRLKGIIHLSHNAHGTLAHPMLLGNFQLKDGMYENGELGLLIQKIMINGHFSKNEIVIDSMQGKDVAQGTVSGSGIIQWSEVLHPVMDIRLSIQNLIMANSDLLLIRGGGKLRFYQNNKEPFTLLGQVMINSADAFLADTAPKTRLLKIRNKEVLSQGHDNSVRHLDAKKTPPFGRIDLEVEIPQKLFVRGFGLTSQWKGKMRLLGALNQPQIDGSLSLIRGQIDVISKTLTLTEGLIKFVPESGSIDPYLKIVATKTVSDVKAMIKIEGRSSRPDINFVSHPFLPQEEVVSLILFGKPLNSVSAAQSLKLATAIASLKTSGRNESITEKFRTAFGLDEIGIQGTDNSDDNSGELSTGYSFHVGKQLTDRAYIALKQGVTGEASTDVSLRYDLTEYAKAEFEAGTGRHANAGGLSWEKKY